jgi:hypothetical protein
MQAPIYATSFSRQYYIREVHRENMTPKILGTVEPVLSELNEGRATGKFWFPDLFYCFLLPLLAALIIVTVVLIGVYFGQKNNHQCPQILDFCTADLLTSPTFCNVVYNECLEEHTPSFGLYVAMIVIGSIAAFFVLLTFICSIVVCAMESRESKKIRSIHQRYSPVFQQTTLNPKYQMRLKYDRGCCCPGTTSRLIVAIESTRGENDALYTGNNFDDHDVLAQDKEYIHAPYQPLRTEAEKIELRGDDTNKRTQNTNTMNHF